MTTPASDVDVSPMVFTEFVSDGRRYRTEEPLVFQIEHVVDDGEELWLFEGEYNIISGAYSREEAWDMVDDHLGWLWREYAEMPPANMTLDAQELGESLRRRFELAPDAS